MAGVGQEELATWQEEEQKSSLQKALWSPHSCLFQSPQWALKHPRTLWDPDLWVCYHPGVLGQAGMGSAPSPTKGFL